MKTRLPPELDMTPDGGFRAPPRPPLTTRIGAVAVVVALVLWFALALIPVVVIAAAIAWAAFRVQLWRNRRAARGARSVYRF